MKRYTPQRFSFSFSLTNQNYFRKACFSLHTLIHFLWTWFLCIVQTLLLGTTANVGMKLFGEVGRSQNIHLFRPGAFRRGAQDRFVIANQSSLGRVKKLIIWHDNTGSHPDWSLARVAVRDLQTNVIYHFLANCTLSLKSSKMEVEKTVAVASKWYFTEDLNLMCAAVWCNEFLSFVCLFFLIVLLGWYLYSASWRKLIRGTLDLTTHCLILVTIFMF